MKKIALTQFLVFSMVLFGIGQHVKPDYGKPFIAKANLNYFNYILGYQDGNYYISSKKAGGRHIYKFDKEHNLLDQRQFEDVYYEAILSNTFKLGDKFYAYYSFQNREEGHLNVFVIRLDGEEIEKPLSLINYKLNSETTVFTSRIKINSFEEEGQNVRFSKIVASENGKYIAFSQLILDENDKKSTKAVTWVFNEKLELVHKNIHKIDLPPYDIRITDRAINNRGEVFILIGKTEKVKGEDYDLRFEVCKINRDNKTTVNPIKVSSEYPRDGRLKYFEELQILVASGFASSKSAKGCYTSTYFNSFDQAMKQSSSIYKFKASDFAQFESNQSVIKDRGLNYNNMSMTDIYLLNGKIFFLAEIKNPGYFANSHFEILLMSHSMKDLQTSIAVVQREFNWPRTGFKYRNQAHIGHSFNDKFFLLYPRQQHNKEDGMSKTICQIEVYDENCDLEESMIIIDADEEPARLNNRFVKFDDDVLSVMIPTWKETKEMVYGILSLNDF